MASAGWCRGSCPPHPVVLSQSPPLGKSTSVSFGWSWICAIPRLPLPHELSRTMTTTVITVTGQVGLLSRYMRNLADTRSGNAGCSPAPGCPPGQLWPPGLTPGGPAAGCLCWLVMALPAWDRLSKHTSTASPAASHRLRLQSLPTDGSGADLWQDVLHESTPSPDLR